jgi:hypothetical protein
MFFKISVFLLLFVVIGCSQPFLPSRLAWDYDYKYAHPDTLEQSKIDSFYSFTAQDSADLTFIGFKSEIRDSLFDTLYVTKELNYYLLADEDFYKNDSLYFYVRAALIDSAGYVRSISTSSDTLGVWFPKVLEAIYQLRIIKIEVP